MSDDEDTKEESSSNIRSIFEHLNKPYSKEGSSPKRPTRVLGAGKEGSSGAKPSEIYTILRGVISAVHDVRKEILELRAALTTFLRELKKERESKK